MARRRKLFWAGGLLLTLGGVIIWAFYTFPPKGQDNRLNVKFLPSVKACRDMNGELQGPGAVTWPVCGSQKRYLGSIDEGAGYWCCKAAPYSALINAIEMHQVDQVENILAHPLPFSLDVVDLNFRTPLCNAIEVRDLAILKLLIDHGADPKEPCFGNKKVYYGETTPLGSAIANWGNAEAIQLLLSKGAPTQGNHWTLGIALNNALLRGEADLVISVISHITDVNMNDREEYPLLLYFSAGGRSTSPHPNSSPCETRVVEALLKKGANTSFKDPRRHLTALDYALENHCEKIIELLKLSGAKTAAELQAGK